MPKDVEVFAFDVLVAPPERQVVMRLGQDGVIFDVVVEPKTTTSPKMFWGGVLLTVVAIFFGVRWAKRFFRKRA